MVDRSPWLAVELTGARPSGCSGHHCLSRGGEIKEGATGILFCLVSRLGRWRTGSGTMTRKGDSVGTVGTKRWRVGGVGTFTGGGAAFYRAEARWGRPGAFNGRR
jgi:hypothetical protein